MELANDILVPVPVLTLNYLPEESLAPPGLYQFALAPEDEAASAAVRALGDGYTRAVALVPNNDWGRRVLQSFATEFEGLGGTLARLPKLHAGQTGFLQRDRKPDGASGSVQRYQRMRANIGGSLQFDPRRRQDAEFIFLAAAAGPGRLLKSQLKFHYSGDLPAYSTSSVNSLDGRSNSDLNGIMFADTPWLIDPQPWIAILPRHYAEHWPEERRLGRLHAMGYDAYNLIASLYASRGGKWPNSMARPASCSSTSTAAFTGALPGPSFNAVRPLRCPTRKNSVALFRTSAMTALIAPDALTKHRGTPQQEL